MTRVLAVLLALFSRLLAAQTSASDGKPLRLAIAGLVHGHVSGFLRAAQLRGDVEIVGLFDPDPALGARYAKTIGLAPAKVFQDLGAMLDQLKPEAVATFTATADHAVVVEACAPRHIPVQIISVEEEQSHALTRGAFAYTVKPATTEGLEVAFERIKKFIDPHAKRLLIVEDNDIERQSIVDLLSHDDIEVATAATGAEALEKLLDRPFDCCVLDLRLPDISGFDLLDKLHAEPSLREIPVVVFTGKDLTPEEDERLRSVAKSILVKDVQSPERLFDETALFLHRVVSALPEAKQKMLERLHASNEILRGHKVLVVDDDARNIFALTTLLEDQEMEIISTTNGREAIEIITNQPEISVVLMDIMMPEMDGYQTMTEIRKLPRAQGLPILALTAKAMKGDRDKCLAAGASDYIAKPVNTTELLSLLRVWLYR
jgi:CheY-like chemotaxis protein